MQYAHINIKFNSNLDESVNRLIVNCYCIMAIYFFLCLPKGKLIRTFKDLFNL